MKFIDLVKDEPQKDLQKGLIRDRLREDLQIPSRAKIAENIIHSLFERGLFAQAVAVYQHMLDDGLLPSPSTDALFLAVSLAASTAPGKSQLEGLKTILAYRSFTETHFMELLDHITGLNIPPEALAQLTRLFISVKEDGYRPSQSLVMKLIELQTRAGDVFAAAETVAEYDFKEGSRAAFDTPAEPYARMIFSAPKDDQAAVDWIMGVMREKDVPVHIMLAMTTPLKPDADTYKYLFTLLGYLYKSNYKPNNSRRKQTTGAVTPPRQLFADMMSLWFNAELHPPASDVAVERQRQIDMDHTVLTIAFRALLHLDDWAGALVVLRTMIELGLEINERTYFVLLRYMARKVYYSVFRARLSFTQPFFAFELMGPFPHWKIDQEPEVVYRWIMGELLRHNCEKVEGEAKEREGMGDLGAPGETWRGRRIDHYPIVNILRRAMQMRASSTAVPWGIGGGRRLSGRLGMR
ncbi:hypothetical protein B0H13DRAFT_1882794 [Mycena leptocephala]|nr:hypothetical protein B0H13DRAFT_1882794 [Mycena leptocephala]